MHHLNSIPVLLCCLVSNAAVAADRPNVIAILVDDIGVGDFGFTGGKDFPTPNIDRLAAEGCRFTNGYSNPMCSPTRAAMLTGRYPKRFGIEDNRKDITKLNAIYRTSFASFDDFALQSKLVYPSDLENDYALEFIKQGQKRDRPWFLFLGHSSPHFPVQATAERADKYDAVYQRGWDVLRDERFARMQKLGLANGTHWQLSPRSIVPVDRDDIANGFSGKENPAWDSLDKDRQLDLVARRMAVFAAMVEGVDTGVGKIVDHLKATKGIGKQENWVNDPAHLMDVMPTLIDITGAQYPAKLNGHQITPIEGTSLLPAMRGVVLPNRIRDGISGPPESPIHFSLGQSLNVDQSPNQLFVFHFEYHGVLRVRPCEWENHILEPLGGPKSPPLNWPTFWLPDWPFFGLPFPSALQRKTTHLKKRTRDKIIIH